MDTLLSRLEEHLERREWVQLEREAIRLHYMERLSARQRGRVLRAWGRAKAGQSDFYGAVKLLERAIPHAMRGGDWDCLGFVRSDLGALYTTIGDIDAGVGYLQAFFLDWSRYEEAQALRGRVKFNLALALKYRRQYTEAIDNYNEAVEWFSLRGYVQEKAMAHQNLAWLYCQVGQLEEAKVHLDLADTYRDTLSPTFEAEQICCWALYYLATGQIGYAIDCVQEVLLVKRLGVDQHHRGQAACIGGRIAVMLGQQSQANLLLNAAIEAAVQAEDPPLASDCAVLRVAIHNRWGGTQEAAQ